MVGERGGTDNGGEAQLLKKIEETKREGEKVEGKIYKTQKRYNICKKQRVVASLL